MPVVGIYTVSLVVLFVERTPLSLKIVHEECLVSLHFVDEAGLDFSVKVSEGAVFSIVATAFIFGAELGLVFFDVVQALHLVVAQVASVAAAASVRMLAHVGGEGPIGGNTPTICLGVEIFAALVVVLLSNRALDYFKLI